MKYRSTFKAVHILQSYTVFTIAFPALFPSHTDDLDKNRARCSMWSTQNMASPVHTLAVPKRISSVPK